MCYVRLIRYLFCSEAEDTTGMNHIKIKYCTFISLKRAVYHNHYVLIYVMAPVLYCGWVPDALQPKAYCTNPGL